MAEGRCVAQNAIGIAGSKIDHKTVPRCIYTSPEVAAVGLTEKEALKKYDVIRWVMIRICFFSKMPERRKVSDYPSFQASICNKRLCINTYNFFNISFKPISNSYACSGN